MPLLHQILQDTTAEHPQQIAFEEGDRTLNYEQFYDRVEALAGALQSLGVEKGDRVSILANNCSDYLCLHYACCSIGVILHVLNTRLATTEMRWALQNAESRMLVVDEANSHQLEELTRDMPCIQHRVGIGELAQVGHSIDQLVDAGVKVNPPRILEDDPVLLIYTSGTTGQPKGALQTHRGSCWNDRLTAQQLELTDEDVYLALMPYFHQAGLIRSRATLSCGGKNLISGKLSEPDTIALMDEKNVTVTMLPSQVYFSQLIQQFQQGRKFAQLRYLIGGGGTGKRSMAMFKSVCESLDCGYLGVYGQTEATGPVTTITNPDCFERPESCGRAQDGIALQIWDEQNQSLATNQVGEIMVKGPTCITYWNNDKANQALYTNGWLHTGDLGRLDEAGFLYFIDRKKELVKTGAENVYPREVEAVLETLPEIREVTIIGLPDEKWGERVTAVVVLQPDSELTLEQIRNHCKGKIGGYKIPKDLKIVSMLPRNATGKIVKRQLREELGG
ncbi:MAG: AMP-binding protein [Pseudomonadales bacterium]|nr:AMP-binding protein [Pseudomonadales bacterium]